MKKIQLPIIIVLSFLIIPSVALASWWNPFSWFHKKAVETPTVQISTPVPTATNDKEIKDLKKQVIELKEKSEGQNKPASVTGNPSPVFNPLVDFSISLSQETSIGRQPGGFPKADYSQSIATIDTFLASPTLVSFKTFCATAKTLNGLGEKKVLNDLRTDFTTKTNTLYENTGNICALAENSSKYRWVMYDPSYLIGFGNASESDDVRKFKIEYNTFLKNLSAYKLIGFSTQNYVGVATPNQGAEKIVERMISRQGLSGRMVSGGGYIDDNQDKSSFLGSFIIPERTLVGIRALLVRSNK
ncbi:MAG: hypothetical protein WDK96_01450 [Candidatus Paceibacterota bacterium]|jgi:hypothetical protein